MMAVSRKDWGLRVECTYILVVLEMYILGRGARGEGQGGGGAGHDRNSRALCDMYCVG